MQFLNCCASTLNIPITTLHVYYFRVQDSSAWNQVFTILPFSSLSVNITHLLAWVARLCLAWSWVNAGKARHAVSNGMEKVCIQRKSCGRNLLHFLSFHGYKHIIALHVNIHRHPPTHVNIEIVFCIAYTHSIIVYTAILVWLYLCSMYT